MTNWISKTFTELTPDELYKIFQLRAEVFIVEQNCAYLDFDDKDQHSIHLGLWQDNKLLAYSRILPPGLAYDQPSIGRICTSMSVRKTGSGRELVKKSIEVIYKLYGEQPIKISAQFYLKKFYESFGFQTKGEIYLEDFIDHIAMIKP